jgi:hypothetical protein
MDSNFIKRYDTRDINSFNINNVKKFNVNIATIYDHENQALLFYGM